MIMIETPVRVEQRANDAILGYLAFREKLHVPVTDERGASRSQAATELLRDLAGLLPRPVEMRIHGHVALATPNGVIFAVAGRNGLLKLRLAEPFPEVDLSVGLLPAQYIGGNWCYCNPRAEPLANLEAWIQSAYYFALQAQQSDRVIGPLEHGRIGPMA